ncbi:alkene reductase [Amorphus sp. 3PC139-8]|uniref:alkene reductase n=1 Tax=Amorphus sp. 3PC139-8 TaxID=2735676 RepID=UPI00345C8160
MTAAALLSSFRLPALELPNRVVMAPMTRSRASREGVIGPHAARYYAQRASAGLIVTEAIGVSAQAHGYPFTPGLWTQAQEAAWREVVERVHAAGGRIVAQLWHVGRVFSTLNNPAGLDAVAPSPVAAEGRIYTPEGLQPLPVPRPLSVEEVRATVADFARTAARALALGFDMVELHAANGYLIEQFLSDDANRRKDAYGGSRTRRLTFLAEILDAAAQTCGGLSRIGARISPFGDFNGLRYGDPAAAMADVVDLLAANGVAYLHVIEPEVSGDGSREAALKTAAPDVLAGARARFPGALIAAGGYDRARAETAVRAGRADLVAFGRPFISNPDLIERLRDDVPLAPWDRRTFYTRGPEGYVDYPFRDGSLDVHAPATCRQT